ncbi:MAG: hypothetical protein KF752_14635, partial [Pirellulaceae bacterium]|nr:hypothetical protein [Pirellulaceae bacterium]
VRQRFQNPGSPYAISSERCRPQVSLRFPIAEPLRTVKKGEKTRATRTSMLNAAIIGGSKTDFRSNNSRVYL